VNEDCTEKDFLFNPRSKIFYDGFYISDTPLASCFFISESILVVVSNNHQIKMLYTQNFSPGIVDEELYEPLDKTRFDFDRSQMLYEKKKRTLAVRTSDSYVKLYEERISSIRWSRIS